MGKYFTDCRRQFAARPYRINEKFLVLNHKISLYKKEPLFERDSFFYAFFLNAVFARIRSVKMLIAAKIKNITRVDI